jgi:hypothetical protein
MNGPLALHNKDDDVHTIERRRRNTLRSFRSADRTKGARQCLRQKKKRSLSLSLPSSLMLSLLYLTQAQTDFFLLHCDCTIERSNAVVAYSVYHHQLRRLARVRTAFRLCVIRLKNTHTDKKIQKAT